MSITIVSSFAKLPVPDAPPERAAADPATADGKANSPDFASVLLGLPVKVSASPADNADDGKSTVDEASPALNDSQFLSVLELAQRNLPNPPRQPERVPLTGSDTPSLAVSGRSDPLVASASISAATTPLELAGQTTDDRWSSALPPYDSDGKAAKIAVSDVAALAFGRAEAKVVEQAPPANNLVTLAPMPPTPSAATMAPEIAQSVQTPLRDASWATDLGHKLLWFASNDKQLAQLTLNPPQLGSVEISLRLDKEGANAHFVSTNADVRGALEAAVPRLREMFANAGIELGQVSVGSESFRQAGDGRQQPARSPRLDADAAILATDSASGVLAQSVASHRGRAMIDIFA